MNGDLAKRAVACPRWRWMEGMLLQDGRRVVSHTRDGQEILYRRHDGSTIVGCYGYLADGNCLPDLDDPATMGCLMALALEAHTGSGQYDAAALVAALEAAP